MEQCESELGSSERASRGAVRVKCDDEVDETIKKSMEI